MAYVAAALNNDEDKKKAINLSDGSTAAAGGGGGASLAPGIASNGADLSGAGTFVGINDYLDNNKEGSQELGKTVAGGIGKSVDTAKGAIQTGTTTFNNASNANKINYNDTAVNNTLNTGQASADFNKLISGTYGGPKSWADLGVDKPATEAVTKATEAGTLSNTQGGRTELLRQYIDRPVAQATGNRNLNSALLSGNETAVGTVKTAGATAAPLQGSLTAAQQAAQNLAAANAANNLGVKNQTLGRVTGYLSAQEQANSIATAQAQAAQLQRDIDARNYLQNLNDSITKQVRPATPEGVIPDKRLQVSTGTTANLPPGWEALGLTQEQAQNLANAVLRSQQVGQDPGITSAYNAGQQVTNVMSAADAARFNQLAAIAGMPQKYVAGGITPGSLDMNTALNNAEVSRAYGQSRIDSAAADAARQQEVDRQAAAAAAAQAAAIAPKPAMFQGNYTGGGSDGGAGPGGGGGFGMNGVDANGNPSNGGVSSPSGYGISANSIGNAVSAIGMGLGLGALGSLAGYGAQAAANAANNADPTNPGGLGAVNGMDAMSDAFGGGFGGFGGGPDSNSANGGGAGSEGGQGGGTNGSGDAGSSADGSY